MAKKKQEEIHIPHAQVINKFSYPEVEQTVIQSLQLDGALFHKYKSLITPFLFTVKEYMEVINIMLAMSLDNKEIDPVSIIHYANTHNMPLNISSIYGNALSFPNARIEQLLLTLRDAYTFRELSSIGNETETKIINGEFAESVEAVLFNQDKVQKLMDIAQTNINKSMIGSVERARKINSGEEIATAKPLYLSNKVLQDALNLHTDRIWLIAAGNKMGKSQFAQSICDDLCQQNPDVAILIFSTEQSEEEILRGMIADRLKVNQNNIFSRNNTEEERELYDKCLTSLQEFDMEFVCGRISMSLAQQKTKKFIADRPNKKHVILLDNFNKLNVSENTHLRTDNEKDDFKSDQIVGLKQDGHPLIIVVHHINKESFNESELVNGFRPTVKSLRGSMKIIDDLNILSYLNTPKLHKTLVAQENMKWGGGRHDDSNVWYDLDNITPERFTKDIYPKFTRFTCKELNSINESLKGNALFNYIESKSEQGVTKRKIIESYRDYLESTAGKEFLKAHMKLSLIEFIKDEQYNGDFKGKHVTNEELNYYLYGKAKNNRGMIENISILEIERNRDNTVDSNNRLHWFISDLTTRSFTPRIESYNGESEIEVSKEVSAPAQTIFDLQNSFIDAFGDSPPF